VGDRLWQYHGCIFIFLWAEDVEEALPETYEDAIVFSLLLSANINPDKEKPLNLG
jgi:hypothetical protein